MYLKRILTFFYVCVNNYFRSYRQNDQRIILYINIFVEIWTKHHRVRFEIDGTTVGWFPSALQCTLHFDPFLPDFILSGLRCCVVMQFKAVWIFVCIVFLVFLKDQSFGFLKYQTCLDHR